jgi:hypothetical protein
MKKLLILLLTVSLFTLSSCSKDFIQVDAIVEKNCTGSYLKIDDKFYYVCNQDVIAAYTNGQQISVSYEALQGCKSKGTPSCDLAFSYESIIEIKEILKQ